MICSVYVIITKLYRIWDIENMKCVRTLIGHQVIIYNTHYDVVVMLCDVM